MLLKNVNLKYPATISLNSAMDASNEPDIEIQKAFEAKNQAVNEKHPLSDKLLGKLKFVIEAFGRSSDECSKHYELWDKVFEFFRQTFNEISYDDTYDDVIRIFSKATMNYIKNEPEKTDTMLNSFISVYTGTYYLNLNPPGDIQQLIEKKYIPDESFRTKLIRMVDKKYKDTSEKSKQPTFFYENLVHYYNQTDSDLKLGIYETIDIKTYYAMSNKNLIYFSMILDTLGTDEVLKYNKTPEIKRSYRSEIDLAGINKDKMIEKIASIHDDKKQIITTTDSILKKYLESKNIKYSKDATSVQNMIKRTNIPFLKELYDLLLDSYHPINLDAENKLDFSNIYENKSEKIPQKGDGLKPSEKVIHRKYFIDTHKLHNNVLEVRYNKNRHLTNVKTQVIGNGVKNIIHNIINDNNMNQNDYHVLTQQEKHLIRTILNMLDKNHLVSNADEEFNERFQILLGEYNAGNNSEILRNQIKQYILHAMKLNMIGRQAGQQMIIEMCF